MLTPSTSPCHSGCNQARAGSRTRFSADCAVPGPKQNARWERKPCGPPGGPEAVCPPPCPLTSSKPMVLSRQSSWLMLGVFVCSSAAMRRAPCRRAFPRGSSSTPMVVRIAFFCKHRSIARWNRATQHGHCSRLRRQLLKGPGLQLHDVAGLREWVWGSGGLRTPLLPVGPHKGGSEAGPWVSACQPKGCAPWL